MTEELKSDFDDAKDFAHQARLEVKKKARTAKLDAAVKAGEGIHRATDGREPTAGEMVDGAKMAAGVKLANARDTASQAGIEVKRKARDAKLAFDHSAAGRALEDAAASTKASAVSAKDSVLDAVLPATKEVEQTSTRGVDISHVENARNDRLESQRIEQAKLRAEESEREQERKRQALLDSAKEKAQGAAAVLGQVRDKAEVALGSAALAAKDQIDALASEQPAARVESRTSTTGVDISSVQNARNDELRAEEARKAELAAAAEPTLGDKAAAAVSRAGEAIKSAYIDATTDAPAPIYTAKKTTSGVDISSGSNPENARLAAAEEERLAKQRASALARQKEVVSDQVDRGIAQPLKEDAHAVESDLSSKLSALGASLQGAAQRIGHVVSEKYNDLAHPAPVEVHEKVSDNGIDTTSIANADNHVIGEQIKAKKSLGGLGSLTAPSQDAAIAQAHTDRLVSPESQASASARAPDTKTAVIKGGLDSAIALQEGVQAAGRRVEGEARYAGNKAKMEARELKETIAAKVSEVAIAPTAL